MVAGISLCFVAVGCGPTVPSTAAVDDVQQCEHAVAGLAEGASPETVKRSIDTLNAAGTKAFPVLIEHVGDSGPAAIRYFQAAAIEGKLNAPTIGEACFGILQGQVEGVWPKAYSVYHVLTRKSVARWWEKRKDMSLHAIRLDAAEQSFDAARKDFETHKSRISKHAVDFLSAHLRDVQADR